MCAFVRAFVGAFIRTFVRAFMRTIVLAIVNKIKTFYLRNLPKLKVSPRVEFPQRSDVQLSERLVPLGIMVAQLKTLLKPLQHQGGSVPRGSRGSSVDHLDTKRPLISDDRCKSSS